jgi:hypothetical protein
MAKRYASQKNKPYGTGIPKPLDITDLMPWEEVARRWNEMSGENISDSRCQQLAGRAEKTLNRELVGVAREMFYEKK